MSDQTDPSQDSKPAATNNNGQQQQQQHPDEDETSKRSTRSGSIRSLLLNYNNKKKTNRKRNTVFERNFLQSLANTEYELQVDPYRGMQRFGDDDDNNNNNCVWRSQCGYGLLCNKANTDTRVPATDADLSLVWQVAHCQCPSLLARTKLANKRKRKRHDDILGKRPTNLHHRSRCDYNPFCLVSMGGVVDDILEHKVVLNVPEWDDYKSEVYRLETRNKLKKVRRSVLVPKQSVSRYLQDSLKDLLQSVNGVEAALQVLHKQHEKLIFTNPLCEKERRGDQLELSMPPGIENLGATCYLNTQLQCLAQNRVFTKGILSWKSSSQDDRMNTVLQHFQSILGTLQYGSLASISTIEFSTALGLDHYEQQDPNEFSRLFLDRMHQSFQNSDLEYLLPHLFQGVVNYETVCLTCKASSNRQEEFMDVNLPIVKPQSTKKKSILETFMNETNLQADLQTCLQTYLQDERLAGDNQYYCSACDCKRDAVRKLTFRKLPPVLNVQLSRYVYNRVKHMKEKVRDKVLLPLDLTLQAPSKEEGKGLEEHRFILCAVMRHKGTSAYSGHYVAEAMDWLTGQWFEFNDELVTLLRDGPSCSYDPSNNANSKEEAVPVKGAKRKKKSALEGSPDAYNMYYVEEKFLAQSVLESIRETKRNPSDDLSVVDQLAIERSENFAELANMCAEDGKAADRLERRRDFVHNKMFSNLESSVATDPDNTVWVAFEPLLRFISCTDRLENLLRIPNDQPILRHHELLCKHDPPGLHPRVARKGKLLPKSVYDAYEEALAIERHSMTGAPKESPVNDCVIQPSESLFCQQCGKDYTSELQKTYDRASSLKILADSLDPTENNFKLDPGLGETWGNECDRYAYIVSRKFITWFRNKVAALEKNHTKAIADAKSVECDVDMLHLSAENAAEGLDHLDLSEFERKEEDDEAIVVHVNGHIVCPHGNFSAKTANSYSYFPFSVWRDIRNIFPHAIELKRKRKGFFDKSEEDDEEFECATCAVEVHTKNSLRDNIADFASHCRKIHFPDWSCVLNREEAILDDHRKFRILYKDEVTKWRNFPTNVKRNHKKKDESLEAVTRMVLCPRVQPVPPRNIVIDTNCCTPTPSDESRLLFLSNYFRPIVCTQHGLPIYSALFEGGPTPDSKSRMPASLRQQICILREDTYKDYLAGIAGVSGLLEHHQDRTANVIEYIAEGANFCEIWKIDSNCHPSLALATTIGGEGSDEDGVTFCCQEETASILFRLEGAVCKDVECAGSFARWEKEETGKDTAQSNTSSDKDTDTQSTCQFDLRIFEVQTGSSLDAALSSLATCAGMPAAEAEGESQVRRSSRKRKSRYPVGAIDEEETVLVDLDANVAALRLLLFERCSKGSQFELDHDLKLVIFEKPTGKSQEPIVLDDGQGSDEIASRKNFQVVDLSFDVSKETLRDLCQKKLPHDLDASFDLAERVVVMRQTVADNTASVAKEGLFDHFIGLSNATQAESKSKKRNGRPEKGFTGTFLLSTGDAVSDPQKSDDAIAIPVDHIGNGHTNTATAGASNQPIVLANETGAGDKKPSPTVAPTSTKQATSSTGSKEVVEIANHSADKPQMACTDVEQSSDDDEVVEIMNGKSNGGRPGTGSSPHEKSSVSVKQRGFFESSDDEGLINFRPFASSTKQAARADADSVLTSNLIQSLSQNPDFKDETDTDLFRAAVQNALSRNPKLKDVEQLIDPSYHAYLELKYG